MGNFNPNLPYIVGMEWVPIAHSVRTLDTGTEWGYGFTITGAPNDAIASVQNLPLVATSSIAGQTLFYNVYPRGQEDDTGDINVVRWSVGTAFVTGAVVSGASATAALTSPSDNAFITFDNTTDKLRVQVDSDFSLAGKRILAVDLIYQAAGTPGFVLEPTIESNTVIYPYGPYITGPASLNQVSELGTVRFGEVNAWWNSATQPSTEINRMPWRYVDMQRWLNVGGSAGADLFIGVRVNTLPLSGFARLGYLAVDVYYCDESRVAYGGTAYGQDPAGLLTFGTLGSTSQAPVMRDPAFATPVTLAPGDYTATVTLADAGDLYNGGDKIAMPQLFEYAGVSSHPPLTITKFKKNVGAFPAVPPIADSTRYMVASGLAGSLAANALQTGEAAVPYITIEGGPVYRTTAGASVEVTQEIHEENNTGDDSRPLLRFYARRFKPEAVGDLVAIVPGGGTVSITATDFAALPELTVGEYGPGTGWKEVNLYAAGASIGGGGGFTSVTFLMDSTSAPVSMPIDQYQILMTRLFTHNNIDGRALISGTDILPNPIFEKARYDGLQNATATWLTPEATPPVEVADTTSTAVVMFAASATEPVEFTAELASMPVSGIGQGCEIPMCVPTDIYGTKLTWTSTPTTGAFGYYKIERSDTVDTDFHTIAQISDIDQLEFTDWEARVGVESTYRISVCLVNDFCSVSFNTTTFTLTAPGVAGAGAGNSVLIFTSNHGPTGNLAYIMQWEGEPIEDYAFPEAGFVELQARYQRDFFTAQYPTERGGEQFSRLMLVQAAAVAAPSLGNFRSLRDLGWAVLPYVCVRDELGNRWFANIQIPSGQVRRNRTVYLADVTVTEITDIPVAVEL